MRRTASSTRRVGSRCRACSAENSTRPPGYMVWWMYFLSFHFLPVSRTLSALTTTTKSPQSACGVKIGLCLPRSTLAMVVAARPSTLSFTSMTTQLRWTVFLLPITVFIEEAPKTEQKSPCGGAAAGGGRYAIRLGVSTEARFALFRGRRPPGRSADTAPRSRGNGRLRIVSPIFVLRIVSPIQEGAHGGEEVLCLCLLDI